MQSRILNQPCSFVITPINWFHLGWIHGIFGVPEMKFDHPDILVKDEDIDNYVDGYDMAKETELDCTPILERMIDLKQLKVENRYGNDGNQTIV